MKTKTLTLCSFHSFRSARSVMEISGRFSKPDVEITTCTAAPTIEEHVQPEVQRFAKPPAPSPVHAPQPAQVS